MGGAASPNNPSDFYTLDLAEGHVLKTYGATWPTVRAQPGAVTVTYVAGYDEVPDALKAAIWMHVQGQHDNLSAADWQALERAIRNMVLPYRVPVI